jgi:hypothetical protein
MIKRSLESEIFATLAPGAHLPWRAVPGSAGEHPCGAQHRKSKVIRQWHEWFHHENPVDYILPKLDFNAGYNSR